MRSTKAVTRRNQRRPHLRSASRKENFKPPLACSRSTSEASGPHCNLACFAPQSA
ncbi:MAG: hypothetical protein ACTS46_01010 [Candidatus Hodgkinia cicadicola]